MIMKVYACSMFLYGAGPSNSSSVVLGSFDLSVYIEALDISSITENKEEKLRVRRYRQLHNDLKRMVKIWVFSLIVKACKHNIPGPPKFYLIKLDYRFPYPLFKVVLFAGEIS